MTAGHWPRRPRWWLSHDNFIARRQEMIGGKRLMMVWIAARLLLGLVHFFAGIYSESIRQLLCYHLVPRSVFSTCRLCGLWLDHLLTVNSCRTHQINYRDAVLIKSRKLLMALHFWLDRHRRALPPRKLVSGQEFWASPSIYRVHHFHRCYWFPRIITLINQCDTFMDQIKRGTH